MSYGASAADGRRGSFVPKRVASPDTAVAVDPWWLCEKRCRWADKVRFVMLGEREIPYPGGRLGAQVRRQLWGRQIRSMVRKRYFTYNECLGLAKAWVRRYGPYPLPEGGVPADLTDERFREWDVAMIRVYREAAVAVIRAQERWHRRDTLDSSKKEATQATAWAKDDIRRGVCPFCGDDLPCELDQVPRMRLVNGEMVAFEEDRKLW